MHHLTSNVASEAGKRGRQARQANEAGKRGRQAGGGWVWPGGQTDRLEGRQVARHADQKSGLGEFKII